MTEHYHVVAINGSPHEGFGNTSQMLAMLGENLSREGVELEEIFLSQYQIGFCTGCATCLETVSSTSLRALAIESGVHSVTT